MGKPYSIDLRERVVVAVLQGGLSRHASARRFGVAPSVEIIGSSACARRAASLRVRWPGASHRDRRLISAFGVRGRSSPQNKPGQTASFRANALSRDCMRREPGTARDSRRRNLAQQIVTLDGKMPNARERIGQRHAVRIRSILRNETRSLAIHWRNTASILGRRRRIHQMASNSGVRLRTEPDEAVADRVRRAVLGLGPRGICLTSLG
jgi:hypothetical protein